MDFYSHRKEFAEKLIKKAEGAFKNFPRFALAHCTSIHLRNQILTVSFFPLNHLFWYKVVKNVLFLFITLHLKPSSLKSVDYLLHNQPDLNEKSTIFSKCPKKRFEHCYDILQGSYQNNQFLVNGWN